MPKYNVWDKVYVTAWHREIWQKKVYEWVITGVNIEKHGIVRYSTQYDKDCYSSDYEEFVFDNKQSAEDYLGGLILLSLRTYNKEMPGVIYRLLYDELHWQTSSSNKEFEIMAGTWGVDRESICNCVNYLESMQNWNTFNLTDQEIEGFDTAIKVLKQLKSKLLYLILRQWTILKTKCLLR